MRGIVKTVSAIISRNAVARNVPLSTEPFIHSSDRKRNCEPYDPAQKRLPCKSNV